MKPVPIVNFCLLAILLVATAHGAPANTRKAPDSSSESVESNESNSKETVVVETNNAAEVTEDTNTAQEELTVPHNVVKNTVTALEPSKTVDRVEQTTTVAKPSDTVEEPKSTNVHDVPELPRTEVKDDVPKATTEAREPTVDDPTKKELELDEGKEQRPVEQETTVVAEVVEQTRATSNVEVSSVTQKVNDPTTLEVTVTLAANEDVQVRADTSENVPVTTETEVVAATTVPDV